MMKMMDQQFQLLRLIVQKMEIHTESNDYYDEDYCTVEEIPILANQFPSTPLIQRKAANEDKMLE